MHSYTPGKTDWYIRFDYEKRFEANDKRNDFTHLKIFHVEGAVIYVKWYKEHYTPVPKCKCSSRLNHHHFLGKFSRQQIDDIFLICTRKQDLTFHANLHEMSNPVSWETYEKYFEMSSATNFILPRVLSIKHSSRSSELRFTSQHWVVYRTSYFSLKYSVRQRHKLEIMCLHSEETVQNKSWKRHAQLSLFFNPVYPLDLPITNTDIKC